MLGLVLFPDVWGHNTALLFFSPPELRMLSFTFLSSNWMQLQGRFVKEQILMAPSGETAQFGFLSLWLKLIKFINTHQQRVRLC